MEDQSISKKGSAPARDSTYYIADGNVVILVENILFKVHRSMLAKDRSTFDGMFGLDTHTMIIDVDDQDDNHTRVQMEGETDDNPISLRGDTVEEFSALLWSLYALPSEIAVAMTAKADDPRLIHLARITHKYQFRSIETWALETLATYYSTSPASPSIQITTQLTELAVLCDCSELLSAAISKWKRILGEGEAISSAIVIAERLNLRDLLGLAYHTMMLKGRDVWNSDPHLTRSHRVHLLSGYYTLSHIGSELASTPPRLKHDNTCHRRNNCRTGWASLWKAINTSKNGLGSQVVKLPNADILGRMMLARSVLEALVDGAIPVEGLTDDMNDRCLKATVKAAQNRTKEIQESLVNWFSDVS
ncbi:hypothetical protein L208DRAFT_1258941 [Tricholoma matsutake]|nr:hypothetical protein L208DRAFT_1258941 [Tricholoma matsutake 945]